MFSNIASFCLVFFFFFNVENRMHNEILEPSKFRGELGNPGWLQ